MGRQFPTSPQTPQLRRGLVPALLGIALALAGCAAVRVPEEGAARPPVRINGADFVGFLVPAPLLPYRVEGAVQLSYRGERESGDMSLQASEGYAYRLELRARLTGSLALDIRFDPARVLLVDYVNKAYIRSANTPDVRLRLFDLDLSPDEFQILLTGRVLRSRFEAGAGSLRPDGSGAVFHDGSALHRFRLAADGLPTEWVKERDGRPVFRVEFRDWLQAPLPGSPPLRLPRKVRLYRGGLPTSVPALLAFGVRDFQPGLDGQVRMDRLPPSAAEFQPGLLPAASR